MFSILPSQNETLSAASFRQHQWYVGKTKLRRSQHGRNFTRIISPRECWESRRSGSSTFRPRHRSKIRLNGTSTSEAASRISKNTFGGKGNRPTSSPSSLSSTHASNARERSGRCPPAFPHSPTPPERGGADAAPPSERGSGDGGVRKTPGDAGRVRRSKDAGGRGRSSGGVGYFELEQRLTEDEHTGCVGSGMLGPGITLKVYGDVWKWLDDIKVASLKNQVVEAHFSHVHVVSVARKAVIIAQVCLEWCTLFLPILLRFRLRANSARKKTRSAVR